MNQMPAKIKSKSDVDEFLRSGIGERAYDSSVPQAAREVMHAGYGRYVATYDGKGNLVEFVYDRRHGLYADFYIIRSRTAHLIRTYDGITGTVYRCRKCLNDTYGLGCFVA